MSLWANGQHWTGSLSDDTFSGAPDQGMGQASATMRSQHDQVNAMLSGIAHDLHKRDTDLNCSCCGILAVNQTGFRQTFNACSCAALQFVDFRIWHRCSQKRIRERQRLVYHMQKVQFCAETVCELASVTQSMIAELAEIGGIENLLNLNHCDLRVVARCQDAYEKDSPQGTLPAFKSGLGLSTTQPPKVVGHSRLPCAASH